MKITGMKIFGTVITLAVIAIAGTGAYLAGSPSNVRMISLDNRRVQDLQSMSSAIDQFYRMSKKLPKDIGELKSSRDIYMQSIVDPESGIPYEYTWDPTPLALNMYPIYRLCATFSLPSQVDDKNTALMRYEPYPGNDFWKHPAGRFCYSLEIKPDPNLAPAIK